MKKEVERITQTQGVFSRRSKKGKGQASLEYLLITGVIFVIIIPIFYIALTESTQQIRLNKAEETVNTLARTADSLYALGPGSRDMVEISMPSGVEGYSIDNRKVSLSLSLSGSPFEISAFSNAPVSGSLNTNAGAYSVPMEVLDSGMVRIGAGNDTSPPIITHTYPDGLINFNNITIKANTNEPAICRYDISDKNYSDMEESLVGNLTNHERHLGILGEGNHVYYARCMDPYGNVMESSGVINFTIITTTESNDTVEEESEPPIVTLISPPDNTTDNDSVVPFKYNVTDASPISFCDLVLNHTVEKSSTNITRNITQNITATLGRGRYNWSINCTDMHGNEGASSQRRIFINNTLDTDPPLVYLMAPDNNTVRDYWLVKFIYNTTDPTSGVSHCILHMNGTLDDGGSLIWDVIDSPVEENNSESITLPMFKANYTWFISCTDNSSMGNTGHSEERFLRINITAGEEAFIDSCAGWCGWEGLSDGTCENNIPLCGSGCGLPYSDSNDCYAGENVSSEYCTGGAEADTCCCVI